MRAGTIRIVRAVYWTWAMLIGAIAWWGVVLCLLLGCLGSTSRQVMLQDGYGAWYVTCRNDFADCLYHAQVRCARGYYVLDQSSGPSGMTAARIGPVVTVNQTTATSMLIRCR